MFSSDNVYKLSPITIGDERILLLAGSLSGENLVLIKITEHTDIIPKAAMIDLFICVNPPLHRSLKHGMNYAKSISRFHYISAG